MIVDCLLKGTKGLYWNKFIDLNKCDTRNLKCFLSFCGTDLERLKNNLQFYENSI